GRGWNNGEHDAGVGVTSRGLLGRPGRTLAAPHGWPIIPTQAGHDAGILATAGIATAMLFVRNPTGVSHSPAEHADMNDCHAGVVALADTLQELAR
nr:M20/M25/M40 family metallo-hydrolase [Nocardioidaceae bacterium]